MNPFCDGGKAFRLLGEAKSERMKPDLLNLLWSCLSKCGGHIASKCIPSGRLEMINSGVLTCLSVLTLGVSMQLS